MVIPDQPVSPNAIVCQYTISLGEHVDPAAFEQVMGDDMMPRTHVSRRTVRRLDLEHRLLKLKAVDPAANMSYVWHVRAHNLEFVRKERMADQADYDRLAEWIEADVRSVLAAWGDVLSVVVFQEIALVNPF